MLILGGGLAGLSAGTVLTRAGLDVHVLEGDAEVGGLARTIVRGPFRFDLGGHRFFTTNERVGRFVLDLMGGELRTVARASQILLNGTHVDYPIRPFNALSALGVSTALGILVDYGLERLRRRLRAPAIVSLEDWVVSQFGRRMFELYFKEYSEKIWGTECHRIAAEWVERRIQGLSLGTAIRRALFRRRGRPVATLAEAFLYPALGIGRIGDRLKEAIEEGGEVLTRAPVERVEHDGCRVRRVTARHRGRPWILRGDEVLSTIPLPALVRRLAPKPPAGVLEAAARLRYRSLVVVAVMVNRERVTDQTWIYVPDKRVPFSRIHEPKNWSARMAPEGQSVVVAEHFCFPSDPIWRAGDEEVTGAAVAHLEGLGFLRCREVLGGAVVRVPHAYPLFEVGYEEPLGRIWDYLSRFGNLHVAGRSGAFRYLNMDHAMESGIEAAERILRNLPAAGARGGELALAGVNG